jgi:hypothetical protein
MPPSPAAAEARKCTGLGGRSASPAAIRTAAAGSGSPTPLASTRTSAPAGIPAGSTPPPAQQPREAVSRRAQRLGISELDQLVADQREVRAGDQSILVASHQQHRIVE